MQTPNLDRSSPAAGPCVMLVGAGVVGRAIMTELVRCGIETLVVDIDPAAVQRACDHAQTSASNLVVASTASPIDGLVAARLTAGSAETTAAPGRAPSLLIESIAENIERKQQFFVAARAALGPDCVLATNTSNLSIHQIFACLPDDTASLGLHFFMPVDQRPLVELIRRPATSDAAVAICQSVAQRMGKPILPTADSPGFVVNRLLAPYLNQSLLLLGRGATAEDLRAAALRFGMPLSPLELIDLIGMRTAFDSGRVFWRHFPKRIDPAPILSGMIKAKRLGKDFGGGFYDYPTLAAPATGTPFPSSLSAGSLTAGSPAPGGLSREAQTVIERYLRDPAAWHSSDLLDCLTLPMWIEAAWLLAAGVVDTFDQVELAMRGGLGYQHVGGFFGYFDALGSDRILRRIEAGEGQPALRAPPDLLEQLRRQVQPSQAIANYIASAKLGET